MRNLLVGSALACAAALSAVAGEKTVGTGVLFQGPVGLQMDVLWTLFPGQDPAKLIEKYGSRWELVHLKDLRKGVKGNLSGGTAVTNDVTLGTGHKIGDRQIVSRVSAERGGAS